MTAGPRQPDRTSSAAGSTFMPGKTAAVPRQPSAVSGGGEARARTGIPAEVGTRAGSAESARGAESTRRVEDGPGGRPAEVAAGPGEVTGSTHAPAAGNGILGGVPPMARPRAAAGALFFDEEGRVLLVEPSYKPGWDIPGGFIEPGESPYAACVREVEEEIGIVPPIGPLLAVDWASDEIAGDMLLFVFDGGLLPEPWRERIRVDMDEIINCAFTPISEVDDVLPVMHARRVRAAAERRGQGDGAGYLERGYLVPSDPALAADGSGE
ncbi:NUDIX hydrolase [Frankia sp. Mgl5]|uniref:NUDIX domain-containing protein n=1 Tax=Frankia sp. Mgl5 TaxID=2933793 RepID=UPI00200EA32B|nr:NUDIX hydrolase [Frankia sp. Mgl5]MCK9930334.1 NUDIX hydrolase [Frankia sp. Mgl5]